MTSEGQMFTSKLKKFHFAPEKNHGFSLFIMKRIFAALFGSGFYLRKGGA